MSFFAFFLEFPLLNFSAYLSYFSLRIGIWDVGLFLLVSFCRECWNRFIFLGTVFEIEWLCKVVCRSFVEIFEKIKISTFLLMWRVYFEFRKTTDKYFSLNVTGLFLQPVTQESCTFFWKIFTILSCKYVDNFFIILIF